MISPLLCLKFFERHITLSDSWILVTFIFNCSYLFLPCPIKFISLLLRLKFILSSVSRFQGLSHLRLSINFSPFPVLNSLVLKSLYSLSIQLGSVLFVQTSNVRLVLDKMGLVSKDGKKDRVVRPYKWVRKIEVQRVQSGYTPEIHHLPSKTLLYVCFDGTP